MEPEANTSQPNPKKRSRPDEAQNETATDANATPSAVGDEDSSEEEFYDLAMNPPPQKLPKFASPAQEGAMIAKRRVLKHSNLFIDKTRPVTGFLMCCQQAHEMTAVSKILPVLAKYLYLYEQQKQQQQGQPEATTTTTAAAAETTAAPTTKEKIPIRQIQDERLAPYNTGVMGLAFIGITGVVASEFLTYVFEKFREDKSFPAKSRIERIIPCDTIVTGRVADLLAAAKVSIAKYFSGEKPLSFGIVYRSRNNPYVTDRDAVIRDVAALVPQHHKVDLKSPNYVILIEVFKSAAAITIMDNYYKLHKLNPFLYVKEGSGKNNSQSKQPASEPEQPKTV